MLFREKVLWDSRLVMATDNISLGMEALKAPSRRGMRFSICSSFQEQFSSSVSELTAWVSAVQ